MIVTELAVLSRGAEVAYRLRDTVCLLFPLTNFSARELFTWYTQLVNIPDYPLGNVV